MRRTLDAILWRSGVKAERRPDGNDPDGLARPAATPPNNGSDEDTLYQQESITIRNAEQSPLLKLPAELRTRIYTFVFSGLHRDFLYFADYPAKTCKPEDFASASSNKLARKELASAIPLLQTSKQVHYETALLPFQIIEFRVKHVKLFNIFVRQNIMEHQRDAIRSVRFYSNFVEDYVSQRGRSGEHITDSALLSLAQLHGLELVIWEHSVSTGGEPGVYSKDRLESMLRLLGGRPELDVVICEGP